MKDIYQGIDVFLSRCPACSDAHDHMIRINILDKTHFNFPRQAFCLFFFKGNEDLVCRGMKRKGIAPCCKRCPDPVSTVNSIFPDFGVEVIRK